MFEAIKAKRLIAKLQGNNLDKNLEVIERLAQIRHPSAIGPIIESLKGLPIARHEERISQAVASFGTDAVAPLIGLLSDALSSTRRLAALTLGRIGDPRAIAPLVKLQLYGDPEVAGKTLHALKSIDENWAKTSQARQVIPDLLEAFHTETSYRRLRAAETLDKIDPGWTAHIRTQELTNALLDSLVDSPSSSEHTLALLDRFCPQWSKDPRARKAGRKLSAQREDTQLTPEACAAMARSGNTACIADLIESIPTQGNNALKALKAMGPDWKQSVTQAHLRRLFDVLFTSSPALGFRVIPSRLGVNASVPLISSPLPGGGPSTGQRNAAAALAEIGSEQVVDTLIEALERGLRREAEDRAKRQPRAVDADGLSPLGESLKDQTEWLLSQFRRAPKPVEP
jgi:HEAT repeat protein